MSGTAPGPDFPPPGGEHPSLPVPSFPPVPPPPRREPRDNTVRNLLIALLIAIFTIVPATGMWVVSSLKDKSSDESSAAPTPAPKGKAAGQPGPEPAAGDPPIVPGPGDPSADPGQPPPADPGQAPGAGRGGSGVCCCDGAPSRCTTAKKGCCKKHGGMCPCQGGR